MSLSTIEYSATTAAEDPVASDLKKVILETFVPSEPIRSAELLRGRDIPLKRTMETLEIPGRSVFIYGERGVGKTSLAQTSAYQFNTSNGDPVLVSCHEDVTFQKLIAQITRKLLALPIVKNKRKGHTELRVGLSMAGLVHRIEHDAEFVPTSIDVNEAVDLLNEATRGVASDKRMVVVLDELDVTDSKFRTDLAYFIKQLGDQQCPVKFILAGIAETVGDLLEKHESASRYLATIELERLPINILKAEVLENGFQRFGATIPDHLSMRVAYVSDGFAHFTHLVGLHIALGMIEKTPLVLTASIRDYEAGLQAAVEDSQAWLKDDYDKAVKKYGDEYARMLWATADHWELERSTEQIYPAYCNICRQIGTTPVPRRKFSIMMGRLKTAPHGEVLKSSRRSWFKFRKTMLRGYCKMQAEAHGVKVGMDYLARAPVRPLRAP